MGAQDDSNGGPKSRGSRRKLKRQRHSNSSLAMHEAAAMHVLPPQASQLQSGCSATQSSADDAPATRQAQQIRKPAACSPGKKLKLSPGKKGKGKVPQKQHTVGAKRQAPSAEPAPKTGRNAVLNTASTAATINAAAAATAADGQQGCNVEGEGGGTPNAQGLREGDPPQLVAYGTGWHAVEETFVTFHLPPPGSVKELSFAWQPTKCRCTFNTRPRNHVEL